MAVIVRASTDLEVSPSGRVTISTAIGIVLGVLSFFTLVLTYQFLPRTKKPIPNTRPRDPLDLTIKINPKPTLLHRIRSLPAVLYRKLGLHATNTNTTAVSNVASGNAGQSSTEERRKGLRPFLILSGRNKPRESRDDIKKKFATTLRLNIHVPHISPPSLSLPSPRTPSRRLYSQLGDDEATQHLTRPSAALLSPWSPAESDYPSSSLGTPTTPLPTEFDDEPLTPPPMLWPLPPVYIPETPLRGSFAVTDDPFANAQPVGFIRRPSKLVPDNEKETKSMIDEVDYMINQWTPELSKDDAFVIGEELEDDWDAKSSDSVSVYTNRSDSPSKSKR